MRVFNVYSLSSLAVRKVTRNLLRVDFLSLFDYADNSYSDDTPYRYRSLSNRARAYPKYNTSLSHKAVMCAIDPYNDFNNTLKKYTHDTYGTLSSSLLRFRILRGFTYGI